MLLAVDVGNTRISFAVMRGKKIIYMDLVDSTLSSVKLRKALLLHLKKINRKHYNVDQVIICSVVPKVLKVVAQSIKSTLSIDPLIIGKDIKVPVKNNYRKPKQVGVDRLVCAYAARELYGKPSIIIDLGTAITLDVISKKGHYEGGLIIPGIKLSAETLFSHTALLPNIKKFYVPKHLIGKDTEESILSGLFNGYGQMCCGLIDSIANDIKGKPSVVVTGGHTQIMKKFIRSKVDVIDKDLVFKGMYLLS
jgi:type III pantothenate kinase